MPTKTQSLFIFFAFTVTLSNTFAQQALSLKAAVSTAVENYGIIKAKANYAGASQAGVKQARRDYLPNVNLAAQQDYGTVNGQNGPLYGFGGLGVSSSGLPLATQNWNAGFGALYLANVNWDFFAFGRAKNKIEVAEAVAARDNNDYRQEIFQHKIRVASAYLNLLAAQRLTQSYRKNLNRADTFRRIVTTRAKNGLIAGVDSSQANAEVSSARITLTKAIDFEQQKARDLSVLLGLTENDFTLDSVFVTQIPADITPQKTTEIKNHPVLDYYKSRIALSDEQAKYYRTFNYPAFSFVGVFQTRGSGFTAGYTQNQTAFTQNYFDGVNPVRANYLFGIGVTWNITQPLRISQQVKALRLTSKGLQDELQQTSLELKANLALSEKNIKNALDNYREAPMQVTAATNAYRQRSVLYKNGLTNLVDVTQTLYALIRAETDRDIAYNNVWQALLLEAASAGDYSLFDSKVNE